MANSNNESWCQGLDGLAQRTAEYYKQVRPLILSSCWPHLPICLRPMFRPVRPLSATPQQILCSRGVFRRRAGLQNTASGEED